MKIESDDKDIAEVLGSGFYGIPRFQREYSWTKENVEDFLRDVVVEAGSEYFIGSVVLYRADTYFGIVDGQQRLTTVTMLLAALRNKFADLGFSELATGLHALIERADIRSRKHYVLQPQSSYPYFQDHIQKFGKPKTKPVIGREEKALASAYGQIVETVDGAVAGFLKDKTLKDEADRKDKARARLEELRDKVLGLKLVWVKVDDQDDAYIIFETLNTRGKDLTVSDLVRNHLLSMLKADNDNVDLARDSYDEILELFARSAADIDVNRFIHHQWLSTRKYVAEKKLFREIRGDIKSKQAEDYLDELSNDAKLYRQISEPTSASWTKQQKDVHDSLVALSLFGVRQPLPMVLSLVREYEAGGLKLKLLKNSLRAIEDSYFAATAIASLPSSGGVSSMYARHARELRAAKSAQKKADVVKALINKLRASRPTLEQFAAGFALLKASGAYTQQRGLVHYTLRRIYLAHEPTTPLDFGGMTIEHLASQSGKTDPATLASIGNLILVDQPLNDKLGNKTFAAKQQLLASQKRIWVDDNVLEAKSWGGKTIDERGAMMAKFAYEKVWAF
jgi:hypothetical protein